MVVQFTSQQEKAIEQAFNSIDTDHSGSIDRDELGTAVQKLLDRKVTDAEVDEMLAKADSDRSGSISLDEFKAMMADHLSRSTNWGKLRTALGGYVGFDQLQQQQNRKAMKRGFQFNLMVVGESGLGKSTLVNTLFRSKIARSTLAGAEDAKIPKTVEIHSVSHVIEEKNVRLRLTVSDTPGFGDHINNDGSWQPILDHINKLNEKYFADESAVVRNIAPVDSRIHACIYFIAPTGHSLKPIDIEFMKKLDKSVNIIPVIAKADTLTLEERAAFKERIVEDLDQHAINVYPNVNEDDDEEDKAINSKLSELLPFAVIGSDKEVIVNGQGVLGRKTKWGFIEVENKDHCEFSNLRDMLIRTHMQDLIDVTHFTHYEKFRAAKLRGGAPAPAAAPAQAAAPKAVVKVGGNSVADSSI
ncbi:septin 9 [Capsaspora owczarzaki ATCC 30864]|uniref:Septin 9 n=1 Tax=Capsaspora owczarzaki (strain ATCC 30864) TaxID=595528 RepID=A0A0D2UJK4_CAPO3|nr:septin 9 [Capsaspora owczarzaki ATCC 30864]KJE95281.1 septin 9 [Capsaspora owczarzaki ATCC 30864]|eukprot:XP_004346425.2 septin 9 [Capsaspora owczarzaki ATCC 30864]